MNAFLFKTEYLATGQSLPFTGKWVNTALSRNSLVVAYISGATATVSLQAQSLLDGFGPIFGPSGAAESYTFSTTAGVSGYMTPAFLDSPIPSIRLVATGSSNGKVWAYINYQN